MKKSLPFVLLCVLALGGGFLLWWAIREKPQEQPANNDQKPVNLKFVPSDFLSTFDLNDDKRVTLDEFKISYGKGSLVFYENDNGPALSAEQAFEHWDSDHNNVVDAKDLKLLENAKYAEFKKQAQAKGLRARDWDGHYLALNGPQNRTYEAELGAFRRGEYPYAGSYWKPKYFASWLRVVTPDNKTVEGFGSHDKGKLFLLTSGSNLSVYDEDKVQVHDLGPDAPQMQYFRALKETPFNDTEGNLKLARKCVKWGMKAEAGMMYARVLVFERDNKEALDALGYRLEGYKYVPKGE